MFDSSLSYLDSFHVSRSTSRSTLTGSRSFASRPRFRSGRWQTTSRGSGRTWSRCPSRRKGSGRVLVWPVAAPVPLEPAISSTDCFTSNGSVLYINIFVIIAIFFWLGSSFCTPKPRKHVLQSGGSPGLVVMGRDSCCECCGFESQHCTLYGHLFTYICLKRRKWIKRGRAIFVKFASVLLCFKCSTNAFHSRDLIKKYFL